MRRSAVRSRRSPPATCSWWSRASGWSRSIPASACSSGRWGTPTWTSTHEPAPDGFLLAYGTAVAPGRKARASLADVVPTLLYYLGLPVGRDMDGYARTDIFRREFTIERPITFIPTYDR